VEAARTYEALGFTYTGAPPEVLSLAYDKPRWKELLREANVPTPVDRVYHGPEVDDWSIFPAIVKPAHAHCSTGIDPDAVVLDADALRERVGWMLDEIGQPAMVEPFVDGREFHVSLWGNGCIDMLPPAEMDFSALPDLRDRLCSYDAKFTPGSPAFEAISVSLPARLRAPELLALEQVCSRAYRVLGCRDYARVDLRLKDGVFFVLDVNPNPDMTVDTSFVLGAELRGTSYGELGSRLVNLAARRHPTLGAAMT
jgi:D-alanine-D-alanine ligase